MWFRHDLRLADNPALTAALGSGASIVAVYICDHEAAGQWRAGAGARWWLAQSLRALNDSLVRIGGKLLLLQGDTCHQLCRLARAIEARNVFASLAYEPWSRGLQKKLEQNLRDHNVKLNLHDGHLLCEPATVLRASNAPYKVYTPFWRTVSKRSFESALPPPKSVHWHPIETLSNDDEAWRALAQENDRGSDFASNWSPGEIGAHHRLSSFLDEALAAYDDGRQRPDWDGTSRLSPHLRWGEISPRQVWNAISARAGNIQEAGHDEAYLKELVWRDFAYNLLYHWPELPTAPLRPEFRNFKFIDDTNHFAAWSKGETGYPFVDAGMRQLWTTGWMHNRARMVTASFLVKNLLIPWQRGARWFWDCLIDADLASNSAGWQWVAGCGTDAAPYFRIFNPIKQSQKHDPDGDYIRRYVPELANLPSKHIHCPWQAPEPVLRQAGIILGKTYPYPIVDQTFTRNRALANFRALKALI